MNSTGRVIWLIWSLAWAGAWSVLAWASWPRTRCLESQLISASGNFCLSYGTVGSWGRVALFLVLAVASMMVGMVPMIAAWADRPPVPPPSHPVWRNPNIPR